jgi:chemotaxis signal transduction protein
MSRALELRAEFDRSFAEAPRSVQASLQDFLAIQVGTDPYAVRLADIAGLFADRRITRLATPERAFLGIAGVRGAVVPVYDLGAFLGYPLAQSWRWLVLAGGASVALAFNCFQGHLRLPPEALAAQLGQQGHSRDFVQEVLHVAGAMRPIVQITRILGAIEHATQRRGLNEES